MFHIRVLPCGYPAAIWGSSFIDAKNIAFSVSVAAAASHAANMAVLVVAVTAGELKMETFPGRELPDGAKRSVQNTNWEVWFAGRTWWHLPANPKPLRPRCVHERRQPWRGARGGARAWCSQLPTLPPLLQRCVYSTPAWKHGTLPVIPPSQTRSLCVILALNIRTWV